MKKLTLLLCFLLSIAAFGQTTLEEYNYLTKGYKLDKETGRDLKSGYELKYIDAWHFNVKDGGNVINRKTTIYGFKKVDENRVAGFLIERRREDTGYIDYLCVPTFMSDKEILNLAVNDFFKKENKSKSTSSSIHYQWNTYMMLSKAYTLNKY
ncbi:MAG: hypothetical protein L3J25_04190 [Flavobacteriaceae bacterium]|nr:hypothetical protein [Flavobacteriaceae bacterium]